MSFDVSFEEGSPATILGRVTGRNGSGSATGVAGEGNWLQQADITSIEVTIYNMDAPTLAVSGPTSVSKTSAILDTPVTANTIWTKDSTGYNFIHDLSGDVFPDGGKTMLVEYKITLSGGGGLYGRYIGPVKETRQT